jgi:pyridoxamine 5'-phosphate oxidase
MQQINFRGHVTKLLKEKSDALFQVRTREAQAVAVISKQSAPLTDENFLKDKVLKFMRINSPIKRPEGWHAYHLALESVEFWHGGKNRFHKRLRYDLINGSWRYQKLQP